MDDRDARLPAHAGPPLGVMDAVSMGWELLASDFWTLMLMGVLIMLMQGVAGPASLIVGPPMMAGLYRLLGRRIDGETTQFGDLFDGFRERFGASVVAALVPFLATLAPALLWGVTWLLFVFGMAAVDAAPDEVAAIAAPDEAAATATAFVCAGIGLWVVVVLAVFVVQMLFLFAVCAVWDYPASGWEAAKASVRLARGRFGSVLGLSLLFAAIWVGAYVLGLLLCIFGVLFTFGAVLVWHSATVLYLYRSWTGRGAVRPAM